MAWVEYGWAEQPQENETAHHSSSNKPFLRPSRHHFLLQAAADVSQGSENTTPN